MRMGIPKVLTTDQGSEFKNHLNEDSAPPYNSLSSSGILLPYYNRTSLVYVLACFFAKVSTCRWICGMDNEYMLPFTCAGQRPG